MTVGKRKGKNANKSFLTWLRRMRGHGVIGPDGNEGVWLYFEEEQQPAEYGNGDYRSSASQIHLH